MTDPTIGEAVELRTRNAAQHESRSRYIPVPLYTLDAALWHFLKGQQGGALRFNRNVTTLGSVDFLYELITQSRKAVPIATVTLRGIAIEVTRLDVIPHSQLDDLEPERSEMLMGIVMLSVRAFITWHRAEYNHALEAAESMRTPAPEIDTDALAKAIAAASAQLQSTTPRAKGRQPDPDNEWARRELELGGNRNDVLEGYMQRQNVDRSNPKAVSQARERFKKATANVGRPGRK